MSLKGRVREFGAVSSSHWMGLDSAGPPLTQAMSAVPWTPVVGALLALWLNDRNGAETVSWASPGERPDTLPMPRSQLCADARGRRHRRRG